MADHRHGKPRKRVTDEVTSKLRREKQRGAHSDPVGALGEDGDAREWPVHGEVTAAVLCSAARKIAAVQALQAVAVGTSEREGALEQGGCSGVAGTTRGDSTRAMASGEAMAAAENRGRGKLNYDVLGIL
jgi:hypothetical protein